MTHCPVCGMPLLGEHCCPECSVIAVLCYTVNDMQERLKRLEREHESLVALCEVDGCTGTRLPGFQRCLWHTRAMKGE